MAKQNKNWVRGLSDAINLATTVAAAIALGYFGGRWLDGRFDTEPWLTIIGFLLGVATGIKAMWEKSMITSNASSTTTNVSREPEQNKNKDKKN
ncbi:MAG: AtpZ/AtpI family protein [Syntrophomonadaceae bacterium]|nr:AtpZ/AtpI family protein [Syntrophomonadaceae bacterium]MDD3888581.1 AtpZ/AtpI family protein [Syntrophomonadaceae bacterium]MDD4549140.1 AtpZ/AtpI family protein [Syntrophomonadaceae bacterium]